MSLVPALGLNILTAALSSGGSSYNPPALVGMTDIALKRTSGVAEIALGNLTLPAADFTLGIAVNLAGCAAVNQPHAIFSMGTPSDSIISDQSALNIFADLGSGMAGPAYKTIVATGRDDADNAINGRTSQSYPTPLLTTRRFPVLTSERMETAFEAMTARFLFYIRRGGVNEFWTVDPAGGAVRIDNSRDDLTTAWTGIASKPAKLLQFVTAAANPIGQSSAAVQRFFRVTGALSADQMQKIAAGADPRTQTTFSAGAGDRFWSFTSAAVGSTNLDLIAGQAATITGAMGAVANIVPNTPQQDMVRVNNWYSNMGKTRWGVPGAYYIKMDGIVEGPDADIYARARDYDTTSIVINEFKVATSVNGAWSNQAVPVPGNTFTRHNWEFRKGLTGTWYSTARPVMHAFTYGTVGQSIEQNMRQLGSGVKVAPNTSLTSTRYYANELGSQQDSFDGQGQFTRGWTTLNNADGYGETTLCNALTTLLGCPVASFSAADNGATIDSYLSNPSPARWDQVKDMIQRIDPRVLVFSQGQGNSADPYATYKPKIYAFRARLRTELPNWQGILMVTPVNGKTTASSVATYDSVRRAQLDFCTETFGDGLIPPVYLGGQITDTLLKDDIHPDSVPAGNGRVAERQAQDMAFLEGAVAAGANGPVITGIRWTAASNQVKVDFALPSGATAIQKPYAAAATGFSVSDDGFSTRLTVTDAQITGATELTITLSTVPAAKPQMRFGYGLPGLNANVDGNGFGVDVGNIIYDNRVPYLNTTLGFPVQTWQTIIQAP